MVLTKRLIAPPNELVNFDITDTNKASSILTQEQRILTGVLDQLTNLFQFSHSVFQDLLIDIEKSSQRIQAVSARVHNATLHITGVEQQFEFSNNVKKNFMNYNIFSFCISTN